MQQLLQQKKLLLLIVGIPFIFLLLGIWQSTRYYSVSELQEVKLELAKELNELNIIQKEKGPTHLLKLTDGSGRHVSALIKQTAEMEKSVRIALLIAKFCTAFSLLTIIFSIISLILAISGILYIYRLGRKALLSRDDLLRSFSQGRKILPWLLASVCASLLLTTIFAISYELSIFPTYRGSMNDSWKLYLGGIGLIVLLFLMIVRFTWKLFKASSAAFNPDPLTIMGQYITPEDAPKLWALVKEIADKTQATLPDKIIMGLNEGFFVTEHPVKLYLTGEASSGRILYLPLPYMTFMNKEEVSTIIAHELGHFVGEDTEYSLRFSPIYASTINNLDIIYEEISAKNSIYHWLTRPVSLLGHFFLNSFHDAVQFWSRKRELAADKMGASVADNATFARALLRVITLTPHINEALNQFWNKKDGSINNVMALIKQSIKEKGFDDIDQLMENKFPHPTDSHPTAYQRLESLNIELTPEIVSRATQPDESNLLTELALNSERTLEQGDESQQVDTKTSSTASVADALVSDFVASSQKNTQEIREKLLPYASEGKETFSVRLRTGFSQFVCFGLALLFIFLSWATFYITNSTIEFIAGMVFLLVCACGFVGYGLYVRKIGKQTLATLTEKGITLIDMKEEVLWLDIEDVGIVMSNSTHTVELFLKQGYEPPKFTSRMKLKYKAKPHLLYLSLSAIVDMTTSDFCEKIFIYWRAEHARHELSLLE